MEGLFLLDRCGWERGDNSHPGVGFDCRVEVIAKRLHVESSIQLQGAITF